MRIFATGRAALGCWRSIAVATAIVAAPASAQKSELGALIGAPYAETAVQAKRDPRVAWTIVTDGVANVWTARAPEFKPVQLTKFTEDDGQPIGQLALSPDGRFLAFAKGMPGANPASLTRPPQVGLWLVEVATGAARPLGPGFDPRFTPDGSRLVFRQMGGLVATGLAPDSSEPKPLFAARGMIGAYQWSPDGTAIAFVSHRQTHSFIGIYRLGAKSVTWLSPSAAFDSAPAWSPDGRQVAFLRMPTKSRAIRRSVLEGVPLSVWIANTTTGKGRQAWREPGENGGYVQHSQRDALRWTAGGNLLLYSEHEGWTRLYRLAPDGRGAQAITPDGCEVSESVVTDDDAVVFSANCGDLNRRHLWRVGADGRGLRQITSGRSIDTTPLPLAGGHHIAFRSGDARRPQRLAIHDGSSGKVRFLDPVPLPQGFAETALVEPQEVTFKATDGQTVHGQLFLPRNAKGRRPAIVFVHGGPFFQTYPGWHDLGVFGMSYAYNQYLAQQGYVVLSVNFRTGTGYGRDFRRAPEGGPLGVSEYRDVLGGARYLQARSDVDPGRIGIWGGSYGGYLTALALARNSDVFKAGVDLSGFHDWTYRWAQGQPPADEYGVSPDEQATALASSPIGNLDGWKSPVFVIAADDDRVVPVEEATDLVERLRVRGVPVESWIAPDEQHIFATHAKTLEKLERITDFFGRTLDRQ